MIYDGSPRFLDVKGTTVKYAINSPSDVFLIDGAYFCCAQGIWFTSPNPQGLWAVASTIPAAIYTIPPEHPKHNVTYVYIYNSTPDVVYVGYTSGYSGEYVAANGVLMFGLGVAVGALLANDWDDDCQRWHVSYHCHTHYYAYGCGAVYHHGYGGYYRSARVYGPYGGAGRSAYFNPATGAWARGGYRYGPQGSAFARAGYNPFTDTFAARANVKTPYGSAGRFYVERDGQSIQGGHRTQGDKAVGWVEGSEGGKIVAGKSDDHQGVIAKDRNGNIYVGKDGKVYKREEGGGWSGRDQNDWEAQPRNTNTSNVDRDGSSKNETRERASAKEVNEQLQRDYSARETSNKSTNRDSADRSNLERSNKPARGSNQRR